MGEKRKGDRIGERFAKWRMEEIQGNDDEHRGKNEFLIKNNMRFRSTIAALIGEKRGFKMEEVVIWTVSRLFVDGLALTSSTRQISTYLQSSSIHLNRSR